MITLHEKKNYNNVKVRAKLFCTGYMKRMISIRARTVRESFTEKERAGSESELTQD